MISKEFLKMLFQYFIVSKCLILGSIFSCAKDNSNADYVSFSKMRKSWAMIFSTTAVYNSLYKKVYKRQKSQRSHVFLYHASMLLTNHNNVFSLAYSSYLILNSIIIIVIVLFSLFQICSFLLATNTTFESVNTLSYWHKRFIFTVVSEDKLKCRLPSGDH